MVVSYAVLASEICNERVDILVIINKHLRKIHLITLILLFELILIPRHIFMPDHLYIVKNVS